MLPRRQLLTVLLLIASIQLSKAQVSVDNGDDTAETAAGQEEDLDVTLIENEDSSVNVTRDCGRPKSDSLTCPDDDIIFYLYSGPNPVRERIDVTNPEWIKKSKFDANLPTVFLAHGYRGGDSLMPMVVAKDAYIKLGTHNVIMADWGILAKGTCYRQAVGSIRAVAKCAGQMFTYLQSAAGVNISSITCVGHSLGSHICGLLTKHITEKLDKIIALDPARPLIRRPMRLDARDATTVQVIHTNAGFYGLSGRQGTVDFCVNNGRTQPFCKTAKNEQLCSHIEAVCFYAESLFEHHIRLGEPCSTRCPIRNFRVARQRRDKPVIMGAHMGDAAEGMYCVKASDHPYCRDAKADDPLFGDTRCCLRYWTQREKSSASVPTLRSLLSKRIKSLLLLN